MAKVRKNAKRQRYQYNRNRKRMNKLRLPHIKCKPVDDKWNNKMSTVKNLRVMGLEYDVNKDLHANQESLKRPPLIPQVISQLEEAAHAPREKCFRLPKNQVEIITYYMDKYGDDYKAMTRDRKNYLQMTWKQLRNKINIFKSIPEQYNEYLEKKNETPI